MVPAAVEAMTAHLLEVGNPSSLHASGRHARRVVEESRETIAQALGCRPGELVFTSGGTEADNLAVKGIHWARQAEDPRRTRVLATAIEHHAVLDPLVWLRDAEGVEVELLPVDQRGRLVVEALREAVERDPASRLADLGDVGQQRGRHPAAGRGRRRARGRARHPGAHRRDPGGGRGAGRLRRHRGVDALSLTAHKLGGPYGVGALARPPRGRVTALVHGGGQERDIRSGTIDTPAIAGFAAAVELAVKQQTEHAARVGALRDDLVRRVIEAVPDAHVHGAGSTRRRAPAARATPTSASPVARATRC